METLKNFFMLLLAHWQEAFVGGFMIVSSVIFIVGLLKEFLIGKITNKLLRKFLLSVTGIFMSFLTTAIYFLIKNVDFSNYPWGSLGVSIGTIVIYWFYENTGLRNLINYIGKKFVALILTVIAKQLGNKKKTETTPELLQGVKEIEDEIRKEVVKETVAHTYQDNDLKKL